MRPTIPPAARVSNRAARRPKSCYAAVMARTRALESVVVPTDFSDGAQLALERALRLPLTPKTKLSLMHVLPDDIPGRLRTRAIDEAERHLEATVARVRGLATAAGLKPSQFVTAVLEGDPATHIVKRARTVEADLVVVGRHGRRPVADFFIGSTAQQLLRKGEVPVLLTQLPAKAAYHRALVAVDVQRPSLPAVKKARPVLRQAVDVTIFHATHMPFEEYVPLRGPLGDDMRKQHLTRVQGALDRLVTQLQLERARGLLQPGDPRLLVLEQVRKRRAELLVVVTHRKKSLERLFMGSVAEWLLAHAACDVLAVQA